MSLVPVAHLTSTPSRSRLVTLSWFAWAATAICVAYQITTSHAKGVVPAYEAGAKLWLSEQDLYGAPGGAGFVYLPSSALLFVPLTALPSDWAAVVWRLLNIILFAAAVRQFSQTHPSATATGNASTATSFALMTALTIPIAWDCMLIGQSTLGMSALLLLAMTEIARQRFWRAALWLGFGVALKPLVALWLALVVLLEPALRYRTVIATCSLALLPPFFFASTGYVLHSYAAFIAHGLVQSQLGLKEPGFAHLFGVLRLLGFELSKTAVVSTSALAALGTLGLCSIARRHLDRARFSAYLYSFGVCYLLLFSPRTERSTYTLLGPTLAYFIVETVNDSRRRNETLFCGLTWLALFCERSIQHGLTSTRVPWVPAPLTACFAAYLIWRLCRDFQLVHKADPIQ